jgi:hypothetical protein
LALRGCLTRRTHNSRMLKTKRTVILHDGMSGVSVNVMIVCCFQIWCVVERRTKGRPKPIKSVSSASPPRFQDGATPTTTTLPIRRCPQQVPVQDYVCMPTRKRLYHKEGNSICYLPHDGSRLSLSRLCTSMKRKAMLVAQTPQRCMNGTLGGMIVDISPSKTRLHNHHHCTAPRMEALQRTLGKTLNPSASRHLRSKQSTNVPRNKSTKPARIGALTKC